MKPALLLLMLLLLTPSLSAQTCCSGGVPLSSNLGLPDSEAGTLQFGLSYDLNALNTLKNGTIVLKDDSGIERNRLTHSILAELGYSFSEKISIDILFSWVRQERTNFVNGIQSDFRFTEGVGDPVILLKYKLFSLNQNQTTLLAGAGLKPPLGASDKTFASVRLNADLQPGSGAWDGIIWAQYTQAMSFRPSLSLVGTASFRYRGTNNNYQETINPLNGERTAQPYRFGHEFQVLAGWSDRFFVGKTLIDPALLFRYRYAATDRIKPDLFSDFNDIPNTGGQWIFINPSLSYWLVPNFSANINFELPLYANITGTQVTPSYRFNLGFYLKLNGKPSNTLIPLQ